MRPETDSLRLYGVTRAKGKMLELGLPQEHQKLRLRANDEPESLLLLAIATLGDTAAQLNDGDSISSGEHEDLDFAASYFDALLSSNLADDSNGDIALLASAAYYLAGRPGSSRVMADLLTSFTAESPIESLLAWILHGNYDSPSIVTGTHQRAASDIAKSVAMHFLEGADAALTMTAAMHLRTLAYASPSARDLLFADLIVSILRHKFESSSWVMLPQYSGLTLEQWRNPILTPSFPKELWPAQMEIGRGGLFGGASGVVQMPTSAGKTRSLEMILRAGFLSERVKLAVVVAPFRALSHEIATSLSLAFALDNVHVNELSDALQRDFSSDFAALFGGAFREESTPGVLVLTPEKLQFVLRQERDLIRNIDLLVYDEAHQFDSGARGVTYELLVTELRAGLPKRAQIVAISAVIRNAESLRSWLLGDHGVVVDGSGLSPTARAVAFATWLERRGQLQFFETSSYYDQPDYFVPRSIESQTLARRGRERVDRVFPDQSNDTVATDVSLYLGLRLAPRGAVAIFAGTKATANKILARAVDVFDRDVSLTRPAAEANPKELAGLSELIRLHFGVDSLQSRAAQLGIFSHHGNTPNGLRLTVEHAMQNELIRFVVCTSTLAQGVNLPIRYLIVAGTQQGRDSISVRDFQNLLGRAGRAGMHTEGLVVFADPRTYDRRRNRRDSWRYEQSTELLDLQNSEDTTSSILSVIMPFSPTSAFANLSQLEITDLLFIDEDSQLARANGDTSLVSELRRRRDLLGAVESFLMANRRASTHEEFSTEAVALCEETFAFEIAADQERIALRQLFILLADSISTLVHEPKRQAEFGRTLLSAKKANLVFAWTQVNRTALLEATTNASLLSVLWPVLEQTFENRIALSMEPANAFFTLTSAWLDGSSYQRIFDLALKENFTKPHGTARWKLAEADLFKLLHSTLAFDAALIVAAVGLFLGPDEGGEGTPIGTFLKALKYGIPDALAISAYEAGFADRAVAQLLRDQLRLAGFEGEDFLESLLAFTDEVTEIVERLPNYFSKVLAGLIANYASNE
jgi:POLQ-like helicase